MINRGAHAPRWNRGGRAALAPSKRLLGVHPLVTFRKALRNEPLKNILASVCAAATFTPHDYSAKSWVKAALLQSLYGVRCDELWIDNLRFNSMYRDFVGLNRQSTHCWSESDHAYAWEQLCSRPALLDAFRDLVDLGRGLIPVPVETPRPLAKVGGLGAHRAEHRPADEPSGAGRCISSSVDVIEDANTALEAAIRAIRANIRNCKLTPDQLAKMLFISRRSLFYIFAAGGTTPGAAIRKERLAFFARMLADPQHRQMKVTAMALDCGFSEIGTMCRQFKHRYGLSAGEYRQSLSPHSLTNVLSCLSPQVGLSFGQHVPEAAAF